MRRFSRWIGLLVILLLTMPVMAQARTVYPLSTAAHDGRMVIVDAKGQRVLLKSVNWFGGESGEFVVGGLDRQPLKHYARLIKKGGFNSVRLPWSNELVERNPVVGDDYLSANPQLKGKRALEVFDAVVKALTDEGLMVIIDNHRSRGDWCCDATHGDGLWWTPDYPEEAWLRDLAFMAKRYARNPRVIGSELRNEIRRDDTLGLKPTWGGGEAKTDWKAAAEKGAEAVLKVAPHHLIFIGTINYQAELTHVRDHPLRLSRPEKLVWVAHDYAWNHPEARLKDPAAFAAEAYRRWGFAREAGHPYSAPVYLSEFGGCVHTEGLEKPCPADRYAFVKAFVTYLKTEDVDWAWWPMNGTQSAGYNRTRGAIEGYGLLKADWSDWVDAKLVEDLTGVKP
ncbi:MAG: cellulase family glycosylhydrolase [Asticcacaulis sp.]